jgi:hypothetical protein
MPIECRVPNAGDVVFFVAKRGAETMEVLRALVIENNDPNAQRVRDRLAANQMDREPLHVLRNDIVPAFEVYAILQTDPGCVVVTERLLAYYGGTRAVTDPPLEFARGPFLTRSRAHEAASEECRLRIRELAPALETDFADDAKAALDRWIEQRKKHDELATLQRSFEAQTEGR